MKAAKSGQEPCSYYTDNSLGLLSERVRELRLDQQGRATRIRSLSSGQKRSRHSLSITKMLAFLCS